MDSIRFCLNVAAWLLRFADAFSKISETLCCIFDNINRVLQCIQLAKPILLAMKNTSQKY